MQEYTTQEISQRFALLDQYERRCVIRFLQETETGHATFDDVVGHLRKQVSTPDERDQVATVLHHHHLPRLDTTDVLDFDSRSGTIRYHGDELTETLLAVTPETHAPGA